MSPRRSRIKQPASLFVIALIVIVTIASGLPWFVAGEDARRPPQEPMPTSLTLPAGVSLTDLEEVRVQEIIDGDTIDVIFDDGRVLRVRYYGIDTPERGDKCFREATDRNESLIKVGGRVLLLPDARNTDRFDRLLRYVFLADGTSVDATLVTEGFGRAWHDDGRYRDTIIARETEAEAADRGCLWK